MSRVAAPSRATGVGCAIALGGSRAGSPGFSMHFDGPFISNGPTTMDVLSRTNRTGTGTTGDIVIMRAKKGEAVCS